jgi:DNA repair exonuclease SbcCD nuclease subunit
VLYPGSIERTSIAEADEEKGYMIVELTRTDSAVRVNWCFRTLPARPLVRHDLPLGTIADEQLEPTIRALVAGAPVDAVLTIRVMGAMTERAAHLLSAAYLRGLAPPSMNIELRLADSADPQLRSGRSSNEREGVLELPL